MRARNLRSMFVFAMKMAGPAAAGAFGMYLLTDHPQLYDAICEAGDDLTQGA